MAAYRRVYDSRHLQADCQELGSAPEPYTRQSSMFYLYLNIQRNPHRGYRVAHLVCKRHTQIHYGSLYLSPRPSLILVKCQKFSLGPNSEVTLNFRLKPNLPPRPQSETKHRSQAEFNLSNLLSKQKTVKFLES